MAVRVTPIVNFSYYKDLSYNISLMRQVGNLSLRISDDSRTLSQKRQVASIYEHAPVSCYHQSHIKATSLLPTWMFGRQVRGVAVPIWSSTSLPAFMPVRPIDWLHESYLIVQIRWKLLHSESNIFRVLRALRLSSFIGASAGGVPHPGALLPVGMCTDSIPTSPVRSVLSSNSLLRRRVSIHPSGHMSPSSRSMFRHVYTVVLS